MPIPGQAKTVTVIGPVLTVMASQFRITAYYAVILDYCDDPEPIVTVTQTVRYNLVFYFTQVW